MGLAWTTIGGRVRGEGRGCIVAGFTCPNNPRPRTAIRSTANCYAVAWPLHRCLAAATLLGVLRVNSFERKVTSTPESMIEWTWWFITAILLAFLMNLMAAYAKPRIDEYRGKRSQRIREANEAKKREFEEQVALLFQLRDERMEYRMRFLELQGDVRFSALLWVGGVTLMGLGINSLALGVQGIPIILVLSGGGSTLLGSILLWGLNGLQREMRSVLRHVSRRLEAANPPGEMRQVDQP